MSDGIMDAERETKKDIERWRNAAIQELLKTFTKEQLADELSKREGVKEFSSTIETDWLVEIINCDRTDDGSIIEHGSGVARILVVK